MPRTCVAEGCSNKPRNWSNLKFHTLPTRSPDRLKQWILALNMDPKTSQRKLSKMHVCSQHFSREDYVEFTSTTGNKSLVLKNTAIPSVLIPGRADVLQDTWAGMDRSPGQIRGTGIQVPETNTAVTEKPALQHIVDEEAILQLMKNCPMCNRKCRCTKRTCGPYLKVYQSCYFCHYQRKWASQPEATNMNAQKATTLTKRKLQPKDKVSVNTKAQTSQGNQTLET